MMGMGTTGGIRPGTEHLQWSQQLGKSCRPQNPGTAPPKPNSEPLNPGCKEGWELRNVEGFGGETGGTSPSEEPVATETGSFNPIRVRQPFVFELI